MFGNILDKIKNDKNEKNRIFILVMGGLFILNYLMFCLHTGKNVFNIFPSIPVLAEKQEIGVFLPDLDSKSIITEKRDAPKFTDRVRYVKFLFNLVVKGSERENTSQAVPVSLFVKKVWMGKDGKCVLDIDADPIKGNIHFAKGSEELFKKALQKTLSENIPGIGEIKLLVQGIPGIALWEI